MGRNSNLVRGPKGLKTLKFTITRVKTSDATIAHSWGCGPQQLLLQHRSGRKTNRGLAISIIPKMRLTVKRIILTTIPRTLI